MAEPKITPAIARTIRAAKKRGDGSRVIAEAVKARHGVELDRRSIDRHLAANPPRPAKRVAEPAETPTTPGPAPELDEIRLLTTAAQELLTRIRGGVSVMGEAALRREWRQTMRQLAKVKAEAQQAKDQDTAALDWVVDKLERYAEQNAPTPPKGTADGVPESPRAAGG